MEYGTYDVHQLIMVALWNRADQYIFILWFLSSIYLSYFFPRLISVAAHWMSTTWCGLSANLECRSETCCARLAANGGLKKSPKNGHLGIIVQICRAISSQIRHVSTIRKKSLSSNISSTYLHNMVNFGLLTAEIDWRVWGTPSYFNGYRVLAALLHGTLLVGVSQTLRR